MPYLDFNTILVSNNDFSESSVKETFALFKSLGIKNFIFTFDYDHDSRPISFAISKFRTLKPYLSSLAPHGVHIYTSFNVIMSEGFVYEPSFNRLSLGHSDRIFLSLPYFDYEDWIESDMNRLLYKNKLKPTFISMERYLKNDDRNFINRFIAIKNSIIALDVNYITSLDATKTIIDLISRSSMIVPCITCNIFEYPGIQTAFKNFQKRITIRNYGRLCNSFFASSHEILKDAKFYPRNDD